MHVIVALAAAFEEAMQPEFADYQRQVLANARAMADVIHGRGYKVVSGGTDDHLFLVDLIDKGITGKDADAALGRANITVNKNAVPNDPQSPFVTSGIRVGTPAITTAANEPMPPDSNWKYRPPGAWGMRPSKRPYIPWKAFRQLFYFATQQLELS